MLPLPPKPRRPSHAPPKEWPKPRALTPDRGLQQQPGKAVDRQHRRALLAPKNTHEVKTYSAWRSNPRPQPTSPPRRHFDRCRRAPEPRAACPKPPRHQRLVHAPGHLGRVEQQPATRRSRGAMRHRKRLARPRDARQRPRHESSGSATKAHGRPRETERGPGQQHAREQRSPTNARPRPAKQDRLLQRSAGQIAWAADLLASSARSPRQQASRCRWLADAKPAPASRHRAAWPQGALCPHRPWRS